MMKADRFEVISGHLGDKYAKLQIILRNKGVHSPIPFGCSKIPESLESTARANQSLHP